MLKIYGIPNCDTMKKAFAWLKEHQIEFIFHNFKKDGLDDKILDNWLKQEKTEVLINKAGSTFKALDLKDKENYNKIATAKKIILANPSIIKRPVLERNNQILAIGFKPEKYSEILLK